MIRELLQEHREKVQILTLDELKEKISNRAIVLCGAGGTGIDLFDILSYSGIRSTIFAETDESLVNTYLRGIEIIHQRDIINKCGADALVIVTIATGGVSYYHKVKNNLEKIGITNIIHASWFRTCPELFYNYSGRNLLGVLGKLNDDNFNKIDKAYHLLSNNVSKNVFEELIRQRLLISNGNQSINKENNIYFNFNLYKKRDDEVFIDCGAFNGDTLKKFLELYGNSFEQYYAFEPDINNYKILANYVKSLNVSEKISILQKGVYSSMEVLKFDLAANKGSFVSKKGQLIIEAITIDSLDVCPTVIKMDVEGSEYDALLGARKTITAYEPVLAISAYHKVNDLWDIPILIHDMNPRYRIYLDAHSCYDDYLYYAVT